ncbi:MAG: carboxypeptidase regulatory-like domain-containing protein [Anaerolineales bacterium]|nr:carboxypeptidase regulatory-like domain-containing protein [Anaerolineales bacterium]
MERPIALRFVALFAAILLLAGTSSSAFAAEIANHPTSAERGLLAQGDPVAPPDPATGIGAAGASSLLTEVAAGGKHTCARIGGDLRCWGDNRYGQLGDGTTVDRVTPVALVGIDSHAGGLVAGDYHTCAIQTNSTVACWGDNRYGQLGDGTATSRAFPAPVAGLVDVTALSSGDLHTCALTGAGAILCWGYNRYGQLGNGGTLTQRTPIVVVASGAHALAAGGSHTCALFSDGAAFCWGLNDRGQLGDGTNIDHWTPVEAIGPFLDAVHVAAGWGHTCALSATGGAMCWGDNLSGQLGDGTRTDQWLPIAVSGLSSGAQQVAGGDYHTCTRTSVGGVHCWGYNGHGEIGDGTWDTRLTPVAVSALDQGVTDIATGDYHSCAVAVVGGLWCWGLNDNGQLGDGTMSNRRSPVAVAWPPPSIPPVNGTVTDGVGNPIPGVQVDLMDGAGAISTYHTGATGQFAFPVEDVGTYTVSVASPVYGFALPSVAITVPHEAPVVFIGALDPGFAPVLFVAGMTGSALVQAGSATDLWPGQVWDAAPNPLSNRLGERQAILAPDVIRAADLPEPLPDQTLYAPLLGRLAEGRIEYVSAGDPQRRTVEGCDIGQAQNGPTLFVFPYDWRLSNLTTAASLRDYVGCIHKFYPDVPINVVAHGMGGYAARYYIVQASPNSRVKQLITIATPWLGAPRFFDALESGLIGLQDALRAPETMRTLLEAYPGLHELLPGATYFDYAAASGEPPLLVEESWDINARDGNTQTLTYLDFIDLANTRYPKIAPCGGDSVCDVGDNNAAFHALPGQDSWVGDSGDIAYHYIFGVRSAKDTFAGYRARSVVLCSPLGCTNTERLAPVTTRGDLATPLISAQRAALGQYPDGANIALHAVVATTQAEDASAGYQGLVQSESVISLTVDLVNGVPAGLAARDAITVPPAAPAFFVAVTGVGEALITNGDGKQTGAASHDLFVRQADEVTYLPASTANFLAIMPITGVFTITFQSGSEPMHIDVVRQGEGAADYAIRWRDVSVAPATALALHIPYTGVESLLYDFDGDGVPETPMPTIPLVIEGPAAADDEPPIVTTTIDAVYNLTILAADPAGVSGIFYSFDGVSFSPYTVTVSAPLTATEAYAFAEDTLGNRSSFHRQLLRVAQAPLILSEPITTTVVGQPYLYNVTATGVPQPSYALLAFPEGMSIDPATGQIQWVPEMPGEYYVTVTAANLVEPAAYQTWKIIVDALPEPKPVEMYLPLLKR